eukprot:CAMPEP_0119012076 /NCGR_PEP_ID=MMETSP1176-20130426/6067_1 /TAXON_ID=265551 /ORGANISM="Synedropsis recta cf, Strain CCMP1620" /LENGTH=101 /DNA_ID=CAMNT_0006964981 /DNA_START=76 /DNA_END=378 /DNA_ORIENTATION=+
MSGSTAPLGSLSGNSMNSDSLSSSFHMNDDVSTRSMPVNRSRVLYAGHNNSNTNDQASLPSRSTGKYSRGGGNHRRGLAEMFKKNHQEAPLRQQQQQQQQQ